MAHAGPGTILALERSKGKRLVRSHLAVKALLARWKKNPQQNWR